MPTLAIANLHDVTMGAGIVAYLEGIDATLAPFGGRFLVHGGPPDVLEGSPQGDFIIIEFPDHARALGWYRSAAYQAILPLRTANAAGDVFLIDTVPSDHRATDILSRVAAAPAGG